MQSVQANANLMNHNICTENFDYNRINGYISLAPHKTSRKIQYGSLQMPQRDKHFTFVYLPHQHNYWARIDPNAQTIRITIIGKLDNTCIRT